MARRRKSNIVSFWPDIPPPVPAVQPEIVERLEWLLGRAKEGNIIHLAYVAIDHVQRVGTGWVGSCEQHLGIAGTAILHHRIMAAYDAAQENDKEKGPGA